MMMNNIPAKLSYKIGHENVVGYYCIKIIIKKSTIGNKTKKFSTSTISNQVIILSSNIMVYVLVHLTL